MATGHSGRGEDDEARLSLIIGGPFHEILRRLGLLEHDELPAFRAAAIFAAVAWLPPAAAALLQYGIAGVPYVLDYFTDPSTYARFIIAVFALVVTDRKADERITLVIANFRSARLVADGDAAALTDALATADRRTSSRLAEGIMLALAIVMPAFAIDYAIRVDPFAWEGRVADGGVALSWAGMAARYVSAPLLIFLVLRWLWRFGAWTHLLFRLSRIPLRLAVLHPDRTGGLSFLSLYPPVFNGLFFAVSSGIAAAFIRDLGVEKISVSTVQIAVMAWVALVVVLAIGPLAVFAPCLAALKQNAILRYGSLATGFHHAFERKWIDSRATGEDLLNSSDTSTAADLDALFGSIWSLRFIPIDRGTVISVALAAGTPMLAVLATQMPVADLATRLVTALF